MAIDLYKENDTIAAIATPQGAGGVGVVKVSGPLASSIFKVIFSPKKEIDSITSHHLYYGWIKDPKNNRLIDEVLCTMMLAPHSYTKEDVLEIQCHSGPALLSEILQLVLDNGARLAEPGEFTKRAFLNGRIDLAQAEAILELTVSKGQAAAKAAANQLSGLLSSKINSIKELLMHSLAAVEVAIDYPEEEDEIITEGHILESLEQQVLPELNELIHAYEQSQLWREGATVLIVGRPNVGKSSILNALLCNDRAIVSPIPGTTRDIIEAEISIQGLVVKIIDTAGIRQSPDPIEALGIEKVGQLAEKASLSLWVWDISDISPLEEAAVLEEIEPLVKRGAVLLILNKIDLIDSKELDKLIKKVKEEACKQSNIQNLECIPISAKDGSGFVELSKAMADHLLTHGQKEPPELLPTLRQKNCAERAAKSLSKALLNLKVSASPEIIAIDIKEAISSLDELTGNSASQDLLDQIFSNFCLGK